MSSSGARATFRVAGWVRSRGAALKAAALLMVVGGLSWSSPAAAQEGTERVPSSNGEGMDTHLFRPAVDSKGFFSVNGSDILGAGDVSFGLVFDWGRTLLRTRDGSVPVDAATGEPCVDANCTPMGSGSGVDALIENSFQGTLGFSYGIENLLTVGLSVPVVIMSGERAYQIGDENAGLYNSGQLDAQKLATVVPHLKLRLTRVQQTVGLAVIAQAGVPIGSAPRDMGADPGFWYWPRIVMESRLGSTGRFRIGLDAGYRGHTGENPRFGRDGTGQPQLAEGELSYGNLGTYGVGLSYRVTPTLDIVAESYGTYLLADDTASAQKFSNEFLGGLKLFVERNSYLMLGAGSRAFSTGFEAADTRVVLGFIFEPSIGDRDGDGIPDDRDACPDDPEDFDGFEDSDGCPDPDNDGDGIPDVDDRCPNVPEDFDGDEDHDGCPEGDKKKDRDGDGIPDDLDKCPDEPEDRDGFQDSDGCPDPDNDGDGIPDVDDACPDQPEDFDGFEDEDGCPDPDNDRDGIPDSEDQCPNDPETYNGFEDEDGCPDKGRVVIEGNDIVILDKIQFATGSAEILPASLPIVEAVAATMKGHPEFKTLEIAGHADERGADDMNLRLTAARAASVRKALVSRGIDAGRLVSQGYGEYCPLDTGSGPAAWDKNRRVEFKVVMTADGSTNVRRGCDAARAKGILPPRAED